MKIDGKYISTEDIVSGQPYLSSERTKLKKDWMRKFFMLNGVYKMTGSFGLLGEFCYYETETHLHDYSSGSDPGIKRSPVYNGGFGLFYNHSLFQLVSKVTYIRRNGYNTTLNLTSLSGSVVRQPIVYDLGTIGWTTDVFMTPTDNFNLHCLLTLQSPEYKNFSGTANFDTGESVDFDFSGNTVASVAGISKVLIEITPSYQLGNLKVWAAGHYFGKQQCNLTNTLQFEGHWETFAGASYSLNKNIDFSLNVVNSLM